MCVCLCSFKIKREQFEAPSSQQYDNGEVHNAFRNQDQTLQQALLDDASHSIFLEEESTFVGDGESKDDSECSSSSIDESECSSSSI